MKSMYYAWSGVPVYAAQARDCPSKRAGLGSVGFDNLRSDLGEQPIDAKRRNQIVNAEAASKFLNVDRLDAGLADELGTMALGLSDAPADEPALESFGIQVRGKGADVSLRTANTQSCNYSDNAYRGRGQMHTG
jgi:hypothetical protein